MKEPSEFIKSICRLYKAKQISALQLRSMVASKVITQEEYEYIISQEGGAKA